MRAGGRMRTGLKYAILLALVVAIGFYIVYGPVNLEDIAPFVGVSLEDIALSPREPRGHRPRPRYGGSAGRQRRAGALSVYR